MRERLCVASLRARISQVVSLAFLIAPCVFFFVFVRWYRRDHAMECADDCCTEHAHTNSGMSRNVLGKNVEWNLNPRHDYYQSTRYHQLLLEHIFFFVFDFSRIMYFVPVVHSTMTSHCIVYITTYNRIYHPLCDSFVATELVSVY